MHTEPIYRQLLLRIILSHGTIPSLWLAIPARGVQTYPNQLNVFPLPQISFEAQSSCPHEYWMKGKERLKQKLKLGLVWNTQKRDSELGRRSQSNLETHKPGDLQYMVICGPSCLDRKTRTVSRFKDFEPLKQEWLKSNIDKHFQLWSENCKRNPENTS